MQVQINNELTVVVLPNVEHEWVLSTKDVAEGYGLSVSGVQKAKERYADELEDGKHFITTMTDRLSGKKTMWTKRGVIRLGFFIKTPMAKEFRDWAEDYITHKTVNNSVGANSTDYIVTIEMAKHLAMSENNGKGFEVRQYFIEAEKELRVVANPVFTVVVDYYAL